MIVYSPTLSLTCSRHVHENYVESSIVIDEETVTFSNAFVWRNIVKSIHPRLPERTNVQISSRHRFDMRKNRSLANSMRLMLERDRFQAAIELEDYSKVKTMSLVIPWHYVIKNVSFTARLLDMTRLESYQVA